MTVVANGTSSSAGSTPQSYGYTESYSTVYASSTTYKVSISESVEGNNLVYTVWVQNNGQVLAVNVEGYNVTGSTAQEEAVGVFVGFTLQIQADTSISQYTNTGYFKSAGTSTVDIGTTPVKVTTYEANTLPETITGCSGTTTTLTAFSFEVGTPQGANAPLVVYEHIAGSDTSDGTTTTYTYVLQVTSITLA